MVPTPSAPGDSKSRAPLLLPPQRVTSILLLAGGRTSGISLCLFIIQPVILFSQLYILSVHLSYFFSGAFVSVEFSEGDEINHIFYF